MPAPRWFWRFLYDRESDFWARRRDEPEHREAVERAVAELARFVAPPGPVADLGCGPGAHARALARLGYEVTGVDGSPGMVAVARDRTARDGLDATYEVADVGARLPFADGSLGGVVAILVLQHLPDPAAFVGEIRRCLRPGGHVLLTAPDRQAVPKGGRYWRLRALIATRVPGVIRFYDHDSLVALVEAQGLAVVARGGAGGTDLVARA